jgi:hypothetical protein
MKQLLLFLLIVLFVIQFAAAQEVVMSVNQSEYYFLVGEESRIPIEFQNDYGKELNAMLGYTVTQEIRQAGMQYTSSNTQSQPFTVPAETQNVDFSFGTSNTPATFKIGLTLTYEDNKAVLGDILIHFVEDESQKQNQENKQQSQSQQTQENQQQKTQQQLQQQMQQMQQQMSKIFQQPQQQNPQAAVQNNQMATDSSALKDEMQKQLQEQQKIKEEFQKNLANNEDFQKMHQDLMQQGFNDPTGTMDPTNSTSGSFKLDYTKDNETVTLQGEMENNQMKSIEKTSSEDIKTLMQKLEQNDEFKKFDSELKKDQYVQKKPVMEKGGNITTLTVPYDKGNSTASIQAKIENNEIKDVKLEKPGKNYWWTFLLIPIIAAAYLLYIKYKRKDEDIPVQKREKPIDYKKEALKLLEEAKDLWKSKKEKDAYGKAASAIRFYYSYKLNIKTELTNTDLIKNLKKNKIEYSNTQKCLNLCGLVEFAKYQTNKKDFDEIIALALIVIK